MPVHAGPWAKLLVLAPVLISLSACTAAQKPNAGTQPSTSASIQTAQNSASTPAVHTDPVSTPPAPPATAPATPPGPWQPNEIGSIPVLEFHEFGSTDGRWKYTPAEFRQLIQDLYDHGFRPVNMTDVVSRSINLPKGFVPVVLTFDDGWTSQFPWAPGTENTADPTPAPDSPVGIMTAFHQAHPDWDTRATFYVNKPAFGSDGPNKLRWLVKHGFEVGDHTIHHVPMSGLSADQMLHEVGGLAAWVQSEIPGYKVTTLAYPDGINKDLPFTTWEGQIDGQSYSIGGAVLVGSGPAPSPYSKAWDPHKIPRIQVVNPSLVGAADQGFIWDGWFKKLLQKKDFYVSDGDPALLTVPADRKADLQVSMVPPGVIVQ